MDKHSQTKSILSWLQRGRKLTAIKALELFDCLRLSGRIKDLRDQGFDIKTRMVTTNTGKRIAEYSL